MALNTNLESIITLIFNEGTYLLFVFLCASFLFVGAIAKFGSIFPSSIVTYAMKGSIPILALIHDATMAAMRNFLITHPFPLFIVICRIINVISLIGIIIIL